MNMTEVMGMFWKKPSDTCDFKAPVQFRPWNRKPVTKPIEGGTR